MYSRLKVKPPTIFEHVWIEEYFQNCSMKVPRHFIYATQRDVSNVECRGSFVEQFCKDSSTQASLDGDGGSSPNSENI